MKIVLQCRFRDSEPRTVEFDGKNDIVLGRPGAALPNRKRRMPAVMFGGGAPILHDGLSKPVLLDLSPDRKVSKIQGRFFFELSAWWIEDLKGVNRSYLNGALVDDPMTVDSGDTIRIGDTLLTVELEAMPEPRGEGIVDTTLSADESVPDPHISEDRRIAILTRALAIAAYSNSRQSMLEAMLRETGEAFPKAAHRTLLLIEDAELVPRAFWPPDRAYVSFTLARRAIQSREGLRWRRTAEAAGAALPSSLASVMDALYSPMLVAGEPIGVIHVDSTSMEPVFSEEDLSLLNNLAITLGMVLRDAGATPLQALPNLPSAFISYAHVQRDFVGRLAADLRRNRVKIWFDERLQTGDAWREKLKTTIGGADAFVLVLSAAAMASEYVKWEMEVAAECGKPVLPVLYEPCTRPPAIEALQYTDPGIDFDKAVRELAGRIAAAIKTK
jgi:hypothetical protein